MKYVYIDFEYCNSQEYFPELVCCSWNTSDDPVIGNMWLYKHQLAKQIMRDKLLRYGNAGYIFVSYAVTAEARCFDALGLDPTDFKWIDLYLEWRQIRNCNDEYNYGRFYLNNMRMQSVPPHINPKLNGGKNNTLLRFGLADCCARLLNANVDKNLKFHMRDLILSAPEKFTSEEQTDILEYCDSDIVYLPQIHEKMSDILDETTGGQLDIPKGQLLRGEFSAHVALMESTGIPLDMEAVKNLRKNVDLAKNKLITNLVENFYPFYERTKKRKSDLLGSWRDIYKNFAQFLETCPQIDIKNWKLTEKSGRYRSDNEYLKQYEGIPEIKEYRETKKILGQLKWFRVPGEGEEDLMNSIGSDGRMRTFFGIYGTQTARNAPMAKQFIFAMSAWLRCLIRAPKGYTITEIDYASQEFAIAAILSKDENMLAAYRSGDPYLFFAKKAKAVPAKGTREKYKAQRDLFKATTLGLQYGMGIRALTTKLSSDMGKKVTEKEAEKLINLHKKVYPRYWRWLKRLDREYIRNKFLQLPCGWVLLGDNPHVLSVRNFPTQGSGSSVIREAVKRCKTSGLEVIATLHDSVYIISKDEEIEPNVAKAQLELRSAFDNILNNDQLDIRLDVNNHLSDKPWISEKGSRFYEILKEYLEFQETEKDLEEKLMSTIYS